MNLLQRLQLTFLVQCLKTFISSETIMILGFLLQEQLTMVLKAYPI